MNTECQQEYQVSLFITGRAQNNLKISKVPHNFFLGKTVIIDTKRQHRAAKNVI